MDKDGNSHWLLEVNMVDLSLIAFMRLNEHKILVFINDIFWGFLSDKNTRFEFRITDGQGRICINPSGSR
jgi:hypothetical protein